jgi:hypothetical protein
MQNRDRAKRMVAIGVVSDAPVANVAKRTLGANSPQERDEIQWAR